MLYNKKKNPVELKHCQTSCCYRIFYLMQPKPQKEGSFLILEYDTSHENQESHCPSAEHRQAGRVGFLVAGCNRTL